MKQLKASLLASPIQSSTNHPRFIPNKSFEYDNALQPTSWSVIPKSPITKFWVRFAYLTISLTSRLLIFEKKTKTKIKTIDGVQNHHYKYIRIEHNQSRRFKNRGVVLYPSNHHWDIQRIPSFITQHTADPSNLRYELKTDESEKCEARGLDQKI